MGESVTLEQLVELQQQVETALKRAEKLARALNLALTHLRREAAYPGFDTHPTMLFSGNEQEMYTQFVGYLDRIRVSNQQEAKRVVEHIARIVN